MKKKLYTSLFGENYFFTKKAKSIFTGFGVIKILKLLYLHTGIFHLLSKIFVVEPSPMAPGQWFTAVWLLIMAETFNGFIK